MDGRWRGEGPVRHRCKGGHCGLCLVSYTWIATWIAGVGGGGRAITTYARSAFLEHRLSKACRMTAGQQEGDRVRAGWQVDGRVSASSMGQQWTW